MCQIYQFLDFYQNHCKNRDTPGEVVSLANMLVMTLLTLAAVPLHKPSTDGAVSGWAGLCMNVSGHVRNGANNNLVYILIKVNNLAAETSFSFGDEFNATTMGKAGQMWDPLKMGLS